MRKEEAETIGRGFREICYPSRPRFLINLGSGDVHRLLAQKPWIHRNIFGPFEQQGGKVIHADLRLMPGVNETVDLTDRSSVARLLAKYQSPKVVMLCNVLEHIPSSMVSTVTSGVMSLVNPGDHIVVSVPKAYPFHPDPIDTMLRPSPDDLMKFFYELDVIEAGVIQSQTYAEELKSMSPLKRIRRLLRPILPVASLGRYLSDVHRLAFLWRRYEISYLLLKRSGDHLTAYDNRNIVN